MTETIETFPVLYILMRADMASMNSGKGMAQSSHAANAFGLAMTSEPDNPLYRKWSSQTRQGFGTVLTLATNEAEMREVVKAANKLGFIADIVHDDTYPLRDGEVTHYLPIDTCAYVFGDKNDPMMGFVLGDLPLHP